MGYFSLRSICLSIFGLPSSDLVTYKAAMTEVFVVWVQLIACLGFGMLGLRVIGHTRENNHDLRNLYAFTLGMGFLGWSLFFIGVTGLLNHIVIFPVYY